MIKTAAATVSISERSRLIVMLSLLSIANYMFAWEAGCL